MTSLDNGRGKDDNVIIVDKVRQGKLAHKTSRVQRTAQSVPVKRNVAQMATKTMTMTKVGATFALDISVKVTTPPIALCCVSRQAEKPQVVEAIKARDEPECAVIFVPCLAPF